MDAQGPYGHEEEGMSKEEERERGREGVGSFKGAWGLLVWMPRDLRGGSFN